MTRPSRLVSIFAFFAAAVLAASCAKKSETIKIGEYASLTGKEATYGQASHKGAVLAVEEINAAGGVLGKKLELITEDDQSKQGEALSLIHI